MGRLFFLSLVIFLACDCSFAEVVIKPEEQPIAIKTSNYSARIEPDGCMTHFAPGGVQFLAPGVSISRGSYFYQGGPLKLSNVEVSNENVVVASGEKADILYEFAEDELKLQLKNKTDKPMTFFMVLNGYVGAVSLDDDKIQKTPLNTDHSQARFFLGKQSLTIEGFNRLWGPWQGPHQIVETSIKPGETKLLKVSASAANESERLQILKLFAMPTESDLTITSPRNFQVIQRYSKEYGRVLISGRTLTDASSVEMRIVGENLNPALHKWRRITIQSHTKKFSTWIDIPAGGWYRLEARTTGEKQSQAEAIVDQFGVGEVFVGAGQSNSTNCGQFKTKQTSGMVSSFSGTEWQIADDPQPGVADRSQGGSFWPAFGDKMFQELGVPIGVATTGYGGTSVNQWQPDGDLFQRWLLTRIHQLGPNGFRAVLWHQGESDVNMPSEEYFTKLRNTILSSTDQAGWEFPWFVAHASYHNADNPRYETVRSAQSRLWKEGIAQPGPDTDVLTGEHRDFDGNGIHFSPKGLKTHGEMWAELLLPYVKQKLSIPTKTE